MRNQSLKGQGRDASELLCKRCIQRCAKNGMKEVVLLRSFLERGLNQIERDADGADVDPLLLAK